MALWTMILRKMANNKWLQLNLWFGLTVCVALFSSMPLYSEAILQRTLLKELQLLQSQSAIYPGFVRVSSTVSSSKMDKETYEAIARADRFVQTIPDRAGLEALSFYQQRFTQKMKVYGADASEQEKQSQKTAGSFKSLSDMEKRVRLIDGRMPVDRMDGVFEALVTQKFLFATKRGLGEELVAESPEEDRQRFRVVPVGVIETDPAADPYLPYLTTEAEDGFIIPFEQFEREFTKGGKARLTDLEWRFALNYEQLSVDNIDQFIKANADIRRYFRGRLGVEDVNVPAIETIASYQGKQAKLDVMMLSLYSPVMLMLAFYLYMAANLIIERQKTEISVLRSRGASRLQIMTAYTLESVLLGLSALAAGPFLGVSFTKVLGASSGFLEFVQRSALEVSLTSSAYKVAAIAVCAAIMLILIPAFLATRVSIVGHKQQMARLTRMSFWHKTGLDVILVSLAVYLLYNFNKRQEDLKRLALDSDALQLDPLLFLMPALFALGGGLLVLRVYPWFIRIIYWAGRRWWSPALYNTLVQISRSSGQYLTIKVFLIMTVATGLFSANAARTINDNMESKIQYGVGADIALTTRWESDAPPPLLPGSPQQSQTDQGFAETRRIQYTEPPFQPFQELEGVEAVAQVFKKEEVRFSAGGSGTSGKTMLYGIDTMDFGKTAWMKNGLLEYPINSYLNLMAPNPKAVLISRSLANAAKIKPGNPIRVSWDGLDQVQFTVFGIIDYWPSWNPLPAGEAKDGKAAEPHLIVGHLGTIQNRLAVEPYEVWLKLKDDVSSQLVYDQLAERKVQVTSLRDAKQELILSKNDPFRLAINGVMTLGFVISMLISFFGFLLFWVLTLSGRTLQYGVLRAMGIPFPQIIGMLVSEQVFTSGAAVIIGVLIGNLISEMFVPLFELSFSTTERVPPFEITYQLSDYMQLYSIVGIMLTIGLLILGYRLSRIRIAQALKLGEE
ncbi:ABC transporter permease [Paenibacillus prosopidis]|uniref:Putative ABC transport system permease protein n=1 Tax=Paenibacillus prosopidis TaxID=630520 RepID=A0A368W0Q7_9BACL|nr:ABC transporter permease [Paenibacillus prosopidis]RCW48412.1 putative ABC transport system permease protein [Paenibacillus prosopidis]